MPQDPYAAIAKPIAGDPYASLAGLPPVPNAASAPPAQKLDMTNDQPSAWGVLTQSPEKTDNEYLGYKGLPGVLGATIHGLNNVARGTTDALAGGLNTIKTAARAWNDPHAEVGDTILPDPHFEQVPGAIRDINRSPDPTGSYLKVAGDTAAQGAGQALTALGLEAAPKALVAATDAAKSGVDATAGVVKGAAKASGIGLSPIEKLVKAAGPSVRDANFPQALETAAPELARQHAITPVKTVGDMAEAAHTAADNLWKQQIEPQITRNATEVINERLPESAPEGLPKAEAQGSIGDKLRGSVDPGMKRMFPNQAAKVMDFAQKLDQPMTLAERSENLRALNAELHSYYKMTPEGRAAAGITDGLTSAMEEGASGLRQQIYDKLDSPAGLRKQYGALKQVQDVFRKRAIVSGRQAPVNLPQILGMTGGLIEGLNQLGAGHPIGALAAAGGGMLPTIFKYLNSPDMLTKRGLAGLPEAPTEPFNLSPPAGRMPTPAQRPFSFMDNPNTNQSGPVAPGGQGVGPEPPPAPNAFDVSGLRSKLTPRWDQSKIYDVSGLRSKLLNASTPSDVPRSLGAAAAEPTLEEMPPRIRELLGLDRRSAPRTAPMSATELEAAIKGRKPITTPFDQTEGAMQTIANDPMMPKHPSAGTANGSGESSASLEAISRNASEKAAGTKRVVVDTRSGSERPLVGPDAVDYKPTPYESVEFRGGKRDGEIIDQGEKARAYKRKST